MSSSDSLPLVLATPSGNELLLTEMALSAEKVIMLAVGALGVFFVVKLLTAPKDQSPLPESTPNPQPDAAVTGPPVRTIVSGWSTLYPRRARPTRRIWDPVRSRWISTAIPHRYR